MIEKKLKNLLADMFRFLAKPWPIALAIFPLKWQRLSRPKKILSLLFKLVQSRSRSASGKKGSGIGKGRGKDLSRPLKIDRLLARRSAPLFGDPPRSTRRSLWK